MILRESRIIAGLGWFLAAWGWLFTVDLIGRADNVTSAQWKYLMSVPGGQWAWIGIFGFGSLVLTVGQLSHRYRIRALGLAAMGLGALLITAFYLAAPLIDPHLTTLGWHPWWGWAVVMFVGAALNWAPVRWS